MSADRTRAERTAVSPVSANGHADGKLGLADRDVNRPGCLGGLAWECQFAPRDGDVYETIEWNYRDVLIRAVDGSTVFRQDRVHAPASWSDQAVQVVASKYFHGDPAKGNDPSTGGRESSVRQLIHRVCQTIADWGLDDGYLASFEDAHAFERDLAWLCLHQHAAFNSPVWFNLGLGQVYGLKGDTDNFVWSEESKCVLQCGDTCIHPQLSACFIQPVEDSIEGIMALAASEARLFKSGSGTGSDLSTLRSSREKVKGGGKASGPVSFMRIWDSVAGTVKSGGKSRRAAKLQTLKCSHPDLREFIVCKRDEDRKARALIASGAAKPGMTGAYDEAYSSVMFQNSNVSTRLTDAFLRAAETPGAVWQTTPVLATTDYPMPSYDASGLLDLMAECTWECGDPGYQFEDTIQAWHTVPNSAPINSANPCIEYMSIDNSACNLASLNLMKFLRPRGSADGPAGTFDVPRFKAACRTVTVAMDILVDRASYPTAAIAANAHRFRQLGLGYANLGTLVMVSGFPYDSEEGRIIAGSVTAIMQGAALETSAELASRLGPFEEHERNRDPMGRIIKRHRDAAMDLWRCAKDRGAPFDSLAYLATRAMDAAMQDGREHGFRNAQSTLLPPCGTIGFMMDADTFGVEPELGLVKYKNLAGGGVMKIVNKSVVTAMTRLGYDSQKLLVITDHLQATGTIHGAPGLRTQHLPIFDCSFEPPGGGRSIAPSGHVKMLAAVQPFLSGAISKTINMPSSATVQDIRQVVLDGWKLGVKALAIYRDGSKGAQPLSTGTKAADSEPITQKTVGATTATPEAPAVMADRPSPRRHRLPDTRHSLTHKFSVAGHEGYLTVGLYPDGSPGEVFLRMAKEGSTVGGLMDAVATSVSLGLQYGVPLDVYAHKFAHGRYEPSGPTSNRDLPFAASLTDYVFRWLASQFPERERTMNVTFTPTGGEPVTIQGLTSVEIGKPDSGQKRIFQDDQLQAMFETGQVFLKEPIYRVDSVVTGDTPACPDCGTLTVRRGACCHCPNCSWSGGCGG